MNRLNVEFCDTFQYSSRNFHMGKRIRIAFIVVTLVSGWLFSGSKYKVYDVGTVTVDPDNYSFYEIESSDQTSLKIELSELSDYKRFDAYLLSERQFLELQSWSPTQINETPELEPTYSWENICKFEVEDVRINQGIYYLMIDNTEFGQPNVDGYSLSVEFEISELRAPKEK